MLEFSRQLGGHGEGGRRGPSAKGSPLSRRAHDTAFTTATVILIVRGNAMFET